MTAPRAPPRLLLVACALVVLSGSAWGSHEEAIARASVTAVEGGEALAGVALGEGESAAGQSVPRFLTYLERPERGLEEGSPRRRMQGTEQMPPGARCNRKGTRVTCQFCNNDLVPYQNAFFLYIARSGALTAFDGTNRVNVNADGTLNTYLVPGACTTFSYTSKQILFAIYESYFACYEALPATETAIQGPQGSSCKHCTVLYCTSHTSSSLCRMHSSPSTSPLTASTWQSVSGML